MGRRKIDWDSVKRDFIFGITLPDGKHVYPSYRELVKKHNLGSLSHLHTKAKKENWEQQRAECRKRIETEVVQKTIDRVSDKLAEVNTEGLDGALEVMKLSRMVLRSLAQAYIHMQKLVELRAKSEAGQDEDNVVWSTKVSRDLALALRGVQQAHKGALEAARLALGEPTEITQEMATLDKAIQETIEQLKAMGKYDVIDVTPVVPEEEA